MPTQACGTNSARPDKVDRRRADRQATVAVALVPEDSALYTCECGEGFTAAVTTCVTCPSCGDGQAW